MTSKNEAQTSDENGSQEPQSPLGGYGEVWRDITAENEITGLPRKQNTFHLTYYSPYHDKTLSGEFIIKKLNVREVAQVGVRRAQLNGGATGVDVVSSMFNLWLAQFEFSIIKAPEWWAPNDEYDENLLEIVFGKVVSFENSFRAAMERKLQGHQRAGEEKRSDEPEDSNPTLVGEEVQAASNG